MYEKMAIFIPFFFLFPRGKLERNRFTRVSVTSREEIRMKNKFRQHRRLEGLTLQLISHPTATLSLTI